jgi:hypothetical protein
MNLKNMTIALIIALVYEILLKLSYILIPSLFHISFASIITSAFFFIVSIVIILFIYFFYKVIVKKCHFDIVNVKLIMVTVKNSSMTFSKNRMLKSF